MKNFADRIRKCARYHTEQYFKKGLTTMSEKFIRAEGYITITGRVNREYFNERVYSAERPVKAPEKKEGEN